MNEKRVHDFTERLAYSVKCSDEPFWEAIYRVAFPSFDCMKDCSNDMDLQRKGIDRKIRLTTGQVLKVDEKKREKPYPDILLEYESKGPNVQFPGWIEKDLCLDYFAYAIMPRRCAYVLDWHLMRRAWVRFGDQWKESARVRAEGMRIVEGKNARYTTYNVALPVDTLLKGMSLASVVYSEHFYPAVKVPVTTTEEFTLCLFSGEEI